MSLKPQEVGPIPEATARVAHAAFPKGNAIMRLRDALGPIYTDEQFRPLFPHDGQPALSPGFLALVTVLQFAEGLSDRQAADAVRARIDWKYGLALELDDPGFDASVLSEYRSRLSAGGAEMLLFESLLSLLREQGLLKARGKQRTDSTHVLAAIVMLNRLECVGETVRHALNVLATVVPDWLNERVPAVWFERYARRFEEYRLPTKKEERYALAEQIGADGRHLLDMIDAETEWVWLREVPAIQILRRVWIQQFYASPPADSVRWRVAEDLPPAPQLMSSPYDPDARWSKKRETSWVGYKVHLTETCDDDLPHLVTNVETTAATTGDQSMTDVIHTHLAEHDLLPGEHIVDMGSMTSDHLVSSQEHERDLVGPVREDSSWQTRAAAGFGVACFEIDWEAQYATCPLGKTSVIWYPTLNTWATPVINIRFAHTDCAVCPQRSQCVSSSRSRALTIRDRAAYEAGVQARKRQKTENFKQAYAKRAGIEGTLSQGVRLGDLRRTRSIGLPKTRLLHLLIATALNVVRTAAWLAETPLAQTRTSPFVALRKPAA
ncbi:MAG TPA: IS1182 family transposase [Ktedonobacteraceae bacterium]|nr:IS1182 family transposase [Ktedonobacteraceae bacterium]